jgi:hypothetical protein
MAEHRIEIIIDQDGKINASTEGIKGEVCLDKLQKLLAEIDDLESFDKTDEWYQSVEVENISKRSLNTGRS